MGSDTDRRRALLRAQRLEHHVQLRLGLHALRRGRERLARGRELLAARAHELARALRVLPRLEREGGVF